jgi:hypothetical protein
MLVRCWNRWSVDESADRANGGDPTLRINPPDCSVSRVAPETIGTGLS